MRSQQQLREEAARAGLRVESIEPYTLPSGERTWAARLSAPADDPWAAVRLLEDQTEDDASDPLVRTWALAILNEARRDFGQKGPTVGPRVRRRFAQLVQQSVQEEVAFIPEPGEVFQSARATIELGAGDCDDHARLVHALARAGGSAAELVILVDGTGEPYHAVAKIGDGTALRWAETTIPARFDEAPRAAFARCVRQGLVSPSRRGL